MATSARFKELLNEATAKLEAATTADQVAALRTEYLGRKGSFTTELRDIAGLPPAKRQAAGKAGNLAKQKL
jgi:phenylalanyl-tRNA synthetase alpha chain